MQSLDGAQPRRQRSCRARSARVSGACRRVPASREAPRRRALVTQRRLGHVEDADGPLLEPVAVAHGVDDHHRVAVREDPLCDARLEARLDVPALAALLLREDRQGVAHVPLDLVGDAAVVADGHDLGLRVVLCEQPRGLARLGEDDDRLGADVGRHLDGRRTRRLDQRDALRPLRLLHLLEDLVVARLVRLGEVGLGLLAGARHDGDRVAREGAVGRLAGEHHGVGAVEHRVRDVRALGARRARVRDHRLEHLRRHDAGLARRTALSNHHLLLAEDLLGRDLHAEVAARDHDAVRGGEDLVELVEPLLVLNLCNHLDGGAVAVLGLLERLFDEVDVLRRLDKGGGDEVDLVRHTKVLQVVDVLGLQHGQVHLDVGQVHVLALADRLVVLDAADDGGGLALLDGEHERAVGDEDGGALLDRGGQLVVRARELGLVAEEGVVGRQLEVLARLEVDLLIARLLEEAGPDLGTLGIEEDGDVLVGPLGRRLAHALEARAVALVVAMRKVEARSVEPRVDEVDERVDVPARRAHRAKDLGLLLRGHGSFDRLRGCD
mmetsp:Transcript_25891/g.77217  ORF Transcript_25891/g.77217 Transcript_25891/m.77217 type:complete len:552 (-) Transcript_25891:3-1658(-)